MNRLYKSIALGALALAGLASGFRGVNVNAYDEAATFSVNPPSEYFNAKYYTDPIPAGYYDTVDTSLKDDRFRVNLYHIISKGYKQHSYKDNNTVLKYTDPDPAQATDPSKRGHVIGFYSGDSITSWNKEHVWAKSHGFPESGYSGSQPYSDAHHLRPTYNNINSTRGNMDFGMAGGSADKYGNKDSDVFEPRDEVKGDVARIMFYMATRYGSETEFNLQLVDQRITSASRLNGRFGGLQTLLRWHYDDPVSPAEIYRNNVIYEEFQHNRNPYIDHPEYVDYAYPNEFSNLPVDEVKVSQVKVLIENLPTTVTLSDKEAITNAKLEYEKLNYSERKLVTNYSKLEKALNDLAKLEKPVDPTPDPNPDPDKPVTPDGTNEGDLSINLARAGVKTSSYQSGVEFSASNLGFYASELYANDSEFRLGYNKETTSLTKFNLNTSGSYLEAKFDTKALKSITINILKWYGSTNSWKLYFTKSGTTTYELINEGHGDVASATLQVPADGRFTLVIDGEKARASLGEYKITTGEGGEITPTPTPDYSSFTNLKPTASVYLKYENSKLTKSNLSFGINSNDKAFKNASDFGTILMPKSKLYGKTMQDYFKSYTPDILKTNNTFIVTSHKSTAVINNGSYQFSISATNMASKLDLELSSCVYVVIDGKLYISKDTTTTFRNTLSNDLKGVDSKTAEIIMNLIKSI